jgi:hypothetical protein
MNTTKLRDIANAAAGRVKRKLLDARDATAHVVKVSTEHVRATLADASDAGAYNNARGRAIFALRKVTGPTTFYPPIRIAWVRVWASAQRDIAALHPLIHRDDNERGSDGFTLAEVRRHAADLADALADADFAAYYRIASPWLNIQRRPARPDIEAIAGDRLCPDPERALGPQYSFERVVKDLMDDLRPVCGRGVRALALLRGYDPKSA